MGNCETRNIPTDAQYYYTKFDNYARDTQVRDTVKLVPKLKNIHGNLDCRVELIMFLDSSRTNSKSGGQTEKGVIDSSTYIMNFQKFFIMEYYFEKDQPIEFRITGAINGTVKTSLPNIMGSRGQTLNKPIEGTDGVIRTADQIFTVSGFEIDEIFIYFLVIIYVINL